MERTFRFTLERAARKSGGDRYSCVEDENWNIYFPQEISRVDGDEPLESLLVTVREEGEG